MLCVRLKRPAGIKRPGMAKWQQAMLGLPFGILWDCLRRAALMGKVDDGSGSGLEGSLYQPVRDAGKSEFRESR